MRSHLEDGSDVDVDQYVSHYIDVTTGEASEPRIFRELLPSSRDVTTALLLDGSSSLGVHGGRIFRAGIGVCGRAFAGHDSCQGAARRLRVHR